MIVAFEGLSCAGKTALASVLVRDNPDLSLVPEFVVPIPAGLSTEFCKINDLAKSSIAQIFGQEYSCVFMDRSWLSTYVYESAVQGENANDLKAWYQRSEASGALLPADLYIYLRLEAEVALQRATSVGRLNMNYAWYAKADTAVRFYDQLFNDTSQGKSIVVDANKPFELLSAEIIEIITHHSVSDKS